MAFNPGTWYRGDEYLFRGISGGADALAEGIKRFREEKKQRKEVEGAFGAVGTTVEKLVKIGSLPPEALRMYADADKGDAATKQGLLKGLSQALAMSAQGAQMQAGQAETTEREARLKLAQEEGERQKSQEARVAENAARQTAFVEKLRQFVTPSQVKGGVKYPVPLANRLTPEAIMKIAAEAGVLTPEGATGLVQQQDRAGVSREPKMKNVGGKDVIFSEFTGAFTVPDNNETAPMPDVIEPTPVLDDKGKVLSYVAQIGGRLLQIPVKDGKDKPEDGTPGPGALSKTHVWAGGRLVARNLKDEILAEGFSDTTTAKPEAKPTAPAGKEIYFDSRGKRIK